MLTQYFWPGVYVQILSTAYPDLAILIPKTHCIFQGALFWFC